GVFGLGDHLDAGVAQQAADALAGEHGVVGDDYPHGSSARSRVGSAVGPPPGAPPRSASWTIAAVRSVPSSSTVTTSRPPSCTALTAAWLGPPPAGAPQASGATGRCGG